MNGNGKQSKPNKPNKPSDISHVHAWLKLPSDDYLQRQPFMYIVFGVFQKNGLICRAIPPGWLVIPANQRMSQFEIETMQVGGYDLPKGIGRDE